MHRSNRSVNNEVMTENKGVQIMTTAYKGTNKLIAGIVFGVLTFWLFAQAMVNVVPAVQEDLGVSSGTVKHCN